MIDVPFPELQSRIQILGIQSTEGTGDRVQSKEYLELLPKLGLHTLA